MVITSNFTTIILPTRVHVTATLGIFRRNSPVEQAVEQAVVLLTVEIRETIFGNIWRSINFNPYQLCPKPRNPTDTYYGTLPRVLALRSPLQLKQFKTSLNDA